MHVPLAVETELSEQVLRAHSLRSGVGDHLKQLSVQRLVCQDAGLRTLQRLLPLLLPLSLKPPVEVLKQTDRHRTPRCACVVGLTDLVYQLETDGRLSLDGRDEGLDETEVHHLLLEPPPHAVSLGVAEPQRLLDVVLQRNSVLRLRYLVGDLSHPRSIVAHSVGALVCLVLGPVALRIRNHLTGNPLASA